MTSLLIFTKLSIAYIGSMIFSKQTQELAGWFSRRFRLDIDVKRLRATLRDGGGSRTVGVREGFVLGGRVYLYPAF